MNRREFLLFLPASGLTALAPRLQSERRRLRFSVSGVRFHADATVHAAGARLEIRRESWNGEPALALLGADGVKVGFVPRKLVTQLDGRAGSVRVVRSRPHALPWRRYVVEAELT